MLHAWSGHVRRDWRGSCTVGGGSSFWLGSCLDFMGAPRNFARFAKGGELVLPASLPPAYAHGIIRHSNGLWICAEVRGTRHAPDIVKDFVPFRRGVVMWQAVIK
jgi:hypothetical protein